MIQLLRSFHSAWQFLTLFPSAFRWEVTPSDLERSPLFFPAVGLILGLLLASLDLALGWVLPARLQAGFLVVFLWVVSGGLHADGLADTADGFFSSKPKERILEIMRDSRSGPMAILALVSVFFLKYLALSELSGPRFSQIVCVPFLGRWSLLILLTTSSYAREGQGLARVFSKKHAPWVLCIVHLLVLCMATALLGKQGFWVVLVSLTMIFLFRSYCDRKIGGFTGDTLGAACELTELSAGVACVLFGRIFG
ncbi:MAG: adenosylcobinamide-GDP ribazoletransferase [Bdellovibrionia bacterium]